MTLVLRVVYPTLFVPLLCSSCIIFTLATAELNNLSDILNSNSSLDIIENETLPEGLPSPPIVPPLVEVIHGKVNSGVHEIHGSIEDIPLLMKTEIKPDANLVSATHINFSTTLSKEGSVPVEQRLLEEVGNLTAPEPAAAEPQENTTAGGTQDDIPSFSEWAKKQMAESHGRNKGENLTVSSGGTKLRFKNYASPDCGAKVVASNPEAVSPSAILSSTRDDYMLNPCNVKIWFVVELCEPIQPQRIEIANFELFSSSPQALSVYTSDRYPSRDWAQTGDLMARDERSVQSFQLPRLSHFVKYLKVELHSHYGSEHFCPISLFRAYGTSEIEVLETVDGEEADPGDEGDEEVGEKRDLLEELEVAAGVKEEVEKEDTLKGRSVTTEEEGGKINLFGSAKKVVLSIVKKAAQVLVKTPGNQSTACGQGGPFQLTHCFTPGYEIICHNCSENLYSKLYEQLCCHGTELQCLLTNEFVNSVISETQLCSEIGLSWSTTNSSDITNYSPKVEYLKAFLPREKIAALCNYLAVSMKRVNLINASHDEPAEEKMAASGNTSDTDEGREESMNGGNGAMMTEAEVIQPSKVMESEPTTLSPEASTEEINLVLETKSVTLESQINTTESMTSSSVPPTSVTSEKEVEEEPNFSPPVVDTKTKPPESDGVLPVVGIADPLSLDSLFPESEEDQLGVKGKPDDIIEQEEARTSTERTVQKESVFVRLANRIKALEVNMSLSSQYLEELSRRYKKQVEELQRNLNGVLEERRLAMERETVQAAQLTALIGKVETLSLTLTELIAERDSWSSKILVFGQHGLIVVLEVLGFIVVVWVWRRLGPNPPSGQAGSQRTPHISRRHSAEEPHPRNTRRRPSEEACLPAGGTHKELLTEAPKRKVSREGARKRKRRRKGGEVVVIGGGGGEGEDWQPLQAQPPDFIKTATWLRGKRSSQTQTSSSQEQLSISSEQSISKPKKTGAFRRIVKKLF